MELHIPKMEELGFRQALLADPATMAYNRGCDLGFPQYHNDTGCIDFPPEDWSGWYARWVGGEPERFYAYLEEDGAFVGEVSLYQTAPGVYEMGIVVHSAQRGRGHSRRGMELLMEAAFGRLGAREVTNHFEADRDAALRIHQKMGFQAEEEGRGMLRLSLTRERFLGRG